MVKKKQIRNDVITQRLQLSEEEVAEKSKIITEMVLSLGEYQQADTIFCYVDFRNEVRTRDVIEDAWSRGKCVAVPQIVGSRMEFYCINKWEDLHTGCMNILEPESSSSEIKIPRARDFMLMPGVAFDVKRNRIGYGGGYYDKYLAYSEKIYKAALAYECQIFEALPCEEHDLKPDIIITEKRILSGV